ncbi:elongation factor Ts, mitochondrial [Olea europaea subsp. europaea]|uniref:Elongation factor Ts, mitochondrial n=1 Tax=Olea europaea subsp. europaea TaxID=158383 RepID=A0A8S0VHB3_OLEEU|nr:elongation factor Ts, mitochondrial [Olea europaea subsp. europaea]
MEVIVEKREAAQWKRDSSKVKGKKNVWDSVGKEGRRRNYVVPSLIWGSIGGNKEKAVVIELNCETNFVARNEIFEYMALSLAKSALLLEGSKQSSCTMLVGPECLETWRGFRNVCAIIWCLVYLSSLETQPDPGVGRIAGLLSLEVEDQNAPRDAAQLVGSDIAMHVVAAKPLFLVKEDVSSDALGHEREIPKSQADICQLGMDQCKVNVLAREYCDDIKRKNKPVILSHRRSRKDVKE